MGSDESHFNVSQFINCEGQSHNTVSTDHNFWRERRAEAVSNRGPSAYQPTALPLGQTGSHLHLVPPDSFLFIYIYTHTHTMYHIYIYTMYHVPYIYTMYHPYIYIYHVQQVRLWFNWYIIKREMDRAELWPIHTHHFKHKHVLFYGSHQSLINRATVFTGREKSTWAF